MITYSGGSAAEQSLGALPRPRRAVVGKSRRHLVPRLPRCHAAGITDPSQCKALALPISIARKIPRLREGATRLLRVVSLRPGRCGNGDLLGASDRLPRRTAIAPQLRANPRIGVGAGHLAWLDDSAMPVRQSRGGVLGVD